MDKSTTFFLPTRKGSQRVPFKNTRSFAGINGGLLENKLRQLFTTKELDEIVLSTNDEECIRIAESLKGMDSRLKIIVRPDDLCLDTTNLQDLILYVPTITEAAHIVWGHVTTPLANGADYDHAIKIYYDALAEQYDSLISVCAFKNFLLDNNARVVNNTTDIPWPRTQDLATLFEINHVMFIASRDVYYKTKNRVGNRPFLHLMEKIKSVDVDWEDDFKIAELIYASSNKA